MAEAHQETEQKSNDSHLKLFGVCVDDSEHSARAFDWYLKSCHKEGNKLAIIHIHVPPPLPAVPMYPGLAAVDIEWNQEIQASIKASRELLHRYRHTCKSLKIPYMIFAETDQGSPGAAITRLAKDNNMVMVVLGTRAYGTLKRAFLGSISDYVVHHAHCPVTVVPPPENKED
eukprot:Seg3863.1 transcript_id=Seg3863.1/GoldUCD/mRNA.D3Y31 product="Universal stress protein Slr1101" protein_id=Seg3863.1/GoldUCD/D3Y31